MEKTVIQVRNVSKKYRIGTYKKEETLFEQAKSLLLYPYRNLKQIRSLSKLSDAKDPTIFHALSNINFDVKEGEILGIIGKNGAGKSTLLKILSKITEPSTGNIKINGRVSSLLEVGTGFHPELTGRDNVYMNGTILGMTKREINQKFDEIVDFSGIEKHIDTPVKFYSSGMKVRLGFAVAAHLEPEVLVIDEVLAVGDAEFQKKCIGKMGEVSTSGRTVLFVSHNMSSINRLCNKALLLEKGQIVFAGPANLAIEQYISFNNSDDKSTNEINCENINSIVSEDLQIDKIEITKENGDTCEFFKPSESILIKISVGIPQALSGMRMNLMFQDNKGEIAFITTSHSTTKNRLSPHKYMIICTIQPNLLNAIDYKLFLNIGIPGFRKILDVTYLTTLKLRGGIRNGNEFPESWPGPYRSKTQLGNFKSINRTDLTFFIFKIS